MPLILSVAVKPAGFWFRCINYLTGKKEMTGLDVAVIIVNWNSGQDLNKCLPALICQTILPSRIIVLDNGSNDFDGQSWKKGYPGVEFHSLMKNTGFAAASNMGASIASDCQWLAFLNPDAFPEPDWLEVLLKAAKSNPEFNFFASFMLSALQPNIIDGTGEVYHSSGLAWRRDHQSVLTDRAMEREEVFGACAAAALISRRAFMDAGGFDESYSDASSEDNDMAYKVFRNGYKLIFDKDIYVGHHHPDKLVRYLKNQAKHGFWRMKLYHDHPNMVMGDVYAGIVDLIRPPLAMLTLVLVPFIIRLTMDLYTCPAP